MKDFYSCRSNIKRISIIPVVLFAFFAFALAFAVSDAHAQQAQLSLADILIGLRSKKATLPERNDLLADAVGERGITFSLTQELEKELENTGADTNLITAIKKKSAFTKSTATIEQKLIPTIIVPAVVEPDSSFYKKQGDEQASKGETVAALESYEKAIVLNPKNPSIYLNRALIYLKNRNFDLAIADYDRVIELSPKELIAYINRANTFEKTGKIDNAVDDYRKILEFDENNTSALNNLKRIEDDRARDLQSKSEVAAQAEAAKVKSKDGTNQKLDEQVFAAPITVRDTSLLVNIGRINASMAVNLVMPVYSQTARNLNLTGQVTVEVIIDEAGNVTSVKSTDGHRLLRESAETAAKRSKIKPSMIEGKAVKSKGFIVYSFVK